MPENVEKPFSFETERDGDTTTLKCHGRLVAGTAQELYEEGKSLIPATKKLVLDLADITYVDSMGLGVLVRLYVHARQQQCELQLLHLGKQLRNLLKLTNLLSVFAQAESHGITIA